MYKKYIIFIVVIIVILVICSCANSAYEESEYEDYCYQIYREIANESFEYAKLYENSIILYNKDFEVINEMEYEKYNAKLQIIYIENSEKTMAFWIKGSLDDGQGILFIKDKYINSALNGIKKLERRGTTSYWFST